MSEFSTPLPSGLSVFDGTHLVRVPQLIEAAEGTAAERKAVIEGFVTDIQAKGGDIALVRADARKAKKDPDVAEATFAAAQAAGGQAAASAPPSVRLTSPREADMAIQANMNAQLAALPQGE